MARGGLRVMKKIFMGIITPPGRGNGARQTPVPAVVVHGNYNTQSVVVHTGMASVVVVRNSGLSTDNNLSAESNVQGFWYTEGYSRPYCIGVERDVLMDRWS